MEFIKPDININFIGKRKIAFAGSLLLIVASIVSLVVKGGPDYGIDFAGGTLIQVQFLKTISPQDIKQALVSTELEVTSVQRFGEEKDNEY